ncbi:MAG TPA: 4Fe-4S ferredoxin [Clostridiales bacterium]|nr:4Fe-4S ferredoxin [Clostridiales bacterium]HBJ97720.1 4Fe-4S ferredoxin [Clostridiales bacterium]
MNKIKRENLRKFFDTISSKMSVYMPIKKAGEVNFGYYDSDCEYDIDELKTVKSAKDVFFPQSEDMMRFKTQGKNVEIVDIRSEKDEYVIFGVKACDYKAFSVLDNVFLSNPVDTFYKLRRDNAIIFTMACSKPKESCFCTVFGIDPTCPQGNVTCYLDENCLYLNANDEKGQKVLDLVKDLLEDGGQEQVEQIKAGTKEILEKLPYTHLDLSRFKPENLNELFNLPVWQELSEACLGCGTCTFVCPTCQCFDIRDFSTNKDIIRFRCWDSCMYSDFTQMAAGNPRTTQMQRYRQRFMHKLVYYPSQYNGMYSCVGCGRCVNKCPQRLNIVKVIKKIGGKENA